MPMLMFSPEDEITMIARSKKAIEVIYTEADIDANNMPGVKPEHVFDFSDGLRMIVSRDEARGFNGIHMSASVCKNTVLGKALLAMAASDPGGAMRKLIWIAAKRFRKIFNMEAKFVGLSRGKGVPHFLVAEPN